MSEDVHPADAPFDLDRIKELVEMMETHGLTEINLRRGDEQWRLRRGPQEVMQMVPASGAYPAAQPPVQAAAEAPAPAAPADNLSVISSPTVGTFYSAPSPDDPPFVSIGTKVQADTVVCLVEAMKVFNQIQADVSGTIVEILAKDGDAVEFGQPLYRVRPE